jgi:formate dehydrogenase beta subunit
MGAIDDEAAHSGYVDHAAYRAAGGYRLLQACLAGRMHPESAIVTMMAAGLRIADAGGGAIPAGRRWRQVRTSPGPRLLLLGVDAGGPWAVQDRHYLGRDPHRVLEGALLAAWAADIDRVRLRLPDGEPGLRAMLRAELAQLRADPPAPGLAHIEADSEADDAPAAAGTGGCRKRCRARRGAATPPCAFCDSLTVLEHDAETLHWVRDILERGADWFTSQGRHGKRGLRSFSVSGMVRVPGVKLVPAGTTARELVDEYSGGMGDGALYAYLPAGAAGAILPAAMADIPLDADTLKRHGADVHPGAVAVLAQGESAADAACAVLRYLRNADDGGWDDGGWDDGGRAEDGRAAIDEALALLAARRGAARLAVLAQGLRDGRPAAARAIDSVLVHFGHELDGREDEARAA